MKSSRTVCLSGLLLCLLVGGYLRLRGSDWGAGNPREPRGSYAHPDERSVYGKTAGLSWERIERREGEPALSSWRRTYHRNFIDPRSGMNIDSYNYGSFPYYVLLGLSNLANHLTPEAARNWFIAIVLLLYATIWLWRLCIFLLRAKPWSPWRKIFYEIPLVLAGISIFAWGADKVFLGESETAWNMDNWGILARPISGLTGTLTLFYIYRIGARLYGRKTGLFAAILLTFSVLHIQLSHYFTFDVILAFFATAAVYSLLVFLDAETWPGRWRAMLAASVWSALALATKFSGILLFIPWFIVLMLSFWRHRPRVALHKFPTFSFAGHLIAIGIVSFATVWFVAFLAQPFGFLDYSERQKQLPDSAEAITPPLSFVHLNLNAGPGFIPPATRAKWAEWLERNVDPISSKVGFHFGWLDHIRLAPNQQDWLAVGGSRFWHNIREQRQMALEGGVPWTRQYENTIPFVYQWKNLIYYGLGPPLGILCLLGLFWGFGKPFYRPTWGEWVVLAWMIPNFLTTHFIHTKFLRYLAPEIPFFCLWAAAFAIWVHARLRNREWRTPAAFPWSRLAGAACVVVVVWSGSYSFAFLEIFTGTHTWTQASDWFAENVPDGKRIVHESWDDPVPWDGAVGGRYQHDSSNPIHSDSPAHLKNDVCRKLEWADYYCFSSKRNYGAMLQTPDEAPNRGRFYKSLFAENLGFRLVKTFSKPVHVLGFPVHFELADESLSLYDHPTVHVFQKVNPLKANECLERILDPPQWIDGLTKEQVLTASEHRSILAPRATFALHRWAIALFSLGWLFWPISYLVFRSSPDGGLFTSKTLAILLLTYLSWFGSSVGWWTNTRGATTIALLILLGASFLALRSGHPHNLNFLKRNWGKAIFGETLFFLVFAWFLVIRMSNPDLNQGEKGMDSSFVNAVYKTETFPATDPWASGEPINYYYYGHTIVGLFGKWVGVPPEYAYNLAVGTWPALVFILVFGIVFNLVRSYAGALLAGFLAIFAGSGKTFFQLASNLSHGGDPVDPREGFREPYVPRGLGQYFSDMWEQVWSALKLAPEVFSVVWATISGGVASGAATLPAGTNLSRLVSFDDYFWRLSRISRSVMANEFPVWTATFADLHAHFLVMPVGLLFVALLIGYIQRGSRLWRLRASGEYKLLEAETGPNWIAPVQIILLGLALGIAQITNTWDVPGLALLTFGACTILFSHQGRDWASASKWTLGRTVVRMRIWGNSIKRWTWLKFGLLTEIVLPLFFIVFLNFVFAFPFNLHYDPPSRVTGIGWMHKAASGWTTPYEFLQIFGVLFIFVLFGLFVVYWRWIASQDGAGWKASICAAASILFTLLFVNFFRTLSSKTYDPSSVEPVPKGSNFYNNIAYWRYLDADIAYVVGGFVLFLLLLVVVFLLRRRAHLAERLGFLLLFLGLGIVAGCEVVYIDEGWSAPDHRKNTVFKLHEQAWLFLALGCGFMFGQWWRRPMELAPYGYRVAGRIFRYGVGYPILVIGLAFAGIFPLLAPYMFAEGAGFQGRTRQIKDAFTLDGLIFMRVTSYDQAAAIDWFRTQTEGTPVILEAAGEHYDYTRSRISTHTGLPTLIGMPHHIRERGNHPEGRTELVRQLYTSTNREKVRELLRMEQVRYVVVGPPEKKLYIQGAGRGLKKFEEWEDLFYPVFHSEVASPGVTIYAVHPSYLLQEDWDTGPPGKAKEYVFRDEGLPLLRGSQGSGAGQYREPRGLFVSDAGRIYVADSFNHRVQAFSETGNFEWWLGEQGEDPGQFNEPRDIEVDESGQVYVLDTWNARVQVFSPTGEVKEIFPLHSFGPNGLTIGKIPLATPEGGSLSIPESPDLVGPFMVIANTGGRNILVFDLNGKRIAEWGAAGEDRLQEPVDVEITPLGLAVADGKSGRIVFFDGQGRFLTSWSLPSSDTGGTTNEMRLAWDEESRLLLATDPEHDRVFVLDETGAILLDSPVGGRPTGIDVTTGGRVYVAARTLHKVILVPLPGLLTRE